MNYNENNESFDKCVIAKKLLFMKYEFKNLDFIGRFLKTKVQNSLQWQVFSPAATAMDKPAM